MPEDVRQTLEGRWKVRFLGRPLPIRRFCATTWFVLFVTIVLSLATKPRCSSFLCAVATVSAISDVSLDIATLSFVGPTHFRCLCRCPDANGTVPVCTLHVASISSPLLGLVLELILLVRRLPA